MKILTRIKVLKSRKSLKEKVILFMKYQKTTEKANMKKK